MTELPATPPARSGRGRRGTRPSGDDRELAILQTAEHLLADRPFSQISTDELARGAGISRPTFYFYFASKEAVLLALIDRIVGGAAQAWGDAMDQVVAAPDDSPADRWRAALESLFAAVREHRTVAHAWEDARASSAELRAMWTRTMENWVERTIRAIEAERIRGAAPSGLPARQLAIVLNAMNSRVMHAALVPDPPALAESEVVDTLLEVWLRLVYGR